MAATITTTANALDTFTAQRPGRLKRVEIHTLFNSITDNADVRVQVSRSAVADFGTSGGAVTQTVAQLSQQGNFVTSGLAQPVGSFATECDDPIAVGEALYINALVTGTVAAATDIILVMQE